MLTNKAPITLALALAIAPLGFNAPAFANGADPSIEELKSLIRQQQQQLEALQQRVEQMEQTSVETQAKVETLKETPPRVVKSGEERISLTISGQINRGALYTDDGDSNDWYFVDNDNSSTRIRAVGVGKVTDDVTIGTNFEAEFELNSSADVNQNNKTNASGKANFKGRKMELYVDSKKYGRGWMGHGSTATDGTAEEDLSGTSVIAYSSVADMAGGVLFRSKDRDEDGDKPLTDIKVGNAFRNLDGLGRDDRVRYDTPNFNGFKASGGAVSSDRWNIAGRYANDFGSVKLAGAVGYSTLTNDDNFKNRWSGSVSGLHSSGFNLTFAAAQDKGRRKNRDDRKYWYLKGGYIAQLVSWGDTAFSIDYYDGKDMNENGDKAKSWGVAAVQNLSDYGTQFYLSLRNYDYDAKTARVDDVFAGMVGARVKF